MDFSTFKEGQLRCVKTLDAPVAVSAGAGSGKTTVLVKLFFIPFSYFAKYHMIRRIFFYIFISKIHSYLVFYK